MKIWWSSILTIHVIPQNHIHRHFDYLWFLQEQIYNHHLGYLGRPTKKSSHNCDRLWRTWEYLKVSKTYLSLLISLPKYFSALFCSMEQFEVQLSTSQVPRPTLRLTFKSTHYQHHPPGNPLAPAEAKQRPDRSQANQPGVNLLLLKAPTLQWWIPSHLKEKYV